MKTNELDFIIALAVVLWLWLRKTQADATPAPITPSAMDQYQTNLEDQYQTPWDAAPSN